MADLLGKDYAPPDIYGKVTGRAKYEEDFRRDGMLFCRLLKSPMPHCRVRGVDATAALAMDGAAARAATTRSVAVRVRSVISSPVPSGLAGVNARLHGSLRGDLLPT